MKDIVEIRWHGRGGQGAKTACLLLADAAFSSGKYVQGFPEYGPERMGAPITAYNRISDTRCTAGTNWSGSTTPETLTVAASIGVFGKFLPKTSSEMRRASMVQTRPS